MLSVNKNIVYYFIILVSIVTYQIISFLLSPYNNKDFIVFLNVGQGDSILLVSKNRYLLIDGGPSSSSTDTVYKYTLNKKPDSFLITHSHSDHFSGFYKMIGSQLNYDLFYSDDNFLMYNKSYVSKKIDMGDEITLGNFSLKSLWPKSGCQNLNPNPCSIVLSVKHKNGKEVLIFGDAEKDVQNDIINKFSKNILAVKVPHHGSRDSFNPEVIDILHPIYTFTSVGQNNYGHPASIVQDYYKQIGARVFRADQDGDLVLFFE